MDQDRVSARRRVLGGDVTDDLDVPEIDTPEAADRYLEEATSRYRLEENRYRLSLTDQHRHSMLMLYGRAIAAPDILHRLGLLDRDQFVTWHYRLTKSVPPVLGETRTLSNTVQALAFADANIRRMQAKREALRVVFASDSVAEHRALFEKYLLNLGGVLEVLAMLLRQRFITASTYDDLSEHVYATLLPDTVDVPRG